MKDTDIKIYVTDDDAENLFKIPEDQECIMTHTIPNCPWNNETIADILFVDEDERVSEKFDIQPFVKGEDADEDEEVTS